MESEGSLSTSSPPTLSHNLYLLYISYISVSFPKICPFSDVNIRQRELDIFKIQPPDWHPFEVPNF